MGGRSQIICVLRAVVFAIVVILSGGGTVAYCQTARVSLIIKQFPAQGGTITPGPGVHHFNTNEEIALTAIPKPGYKFIRWLGDVSDPQANSTITQLNGPKIVIAVFESSEYEGLFPKTSAPGGGGTQIGTGGFTGIGNNSSLMGGGGKAVSPKVAFTSLPNKPDLPSPELPVVLVPVEEPSIVLVPVSDDQAVPEPATGTMLILGGLFSLFKRRTKR